MRRIPFFFFLLISLFFSEKIAGQRTFQAGIIAGLTAAQLDGDLAYGFRQPGFQGGGRVAFFIRPKQQLSLEMTFTQRGARQSENPEILLAGFNVRTNYVDIPVQWHYNDWKIDDDGDEYYKVSLNLGLFYGRLLNWKTSCSFPPCDFFDKRLELANKNDFGWLAGATFFVNKNLGFTVRYQRSILYLFNPENHKKPNGDFVVNADRLTSYFLNLQTTWMF
jgi:Outer membrane protein beta-barrel domain